MNLPSNWDFHNLQVYVPNVPTCDLHDDIRNEFPIFLSFLVATVAHRSFPLSFPFEFAFELGSSQFATLASIPGKLGNTFSVPDFNKCKLSLASSR